MPNDRLTPPKFVFDIWTDFVCPFSYVQLPVFDELRARFGDDLAFRWHAFEVCPESNPQQDRDNASTMARCVQAILPLAHERGVDLHLPDVIPRTRAAFEMLSAAQRLGQLDVLQRAIFKAYFIHGADIGNAQVLLNIASAAGLDMEALGAAMRERPGTEDVLADQALAGRMGVTGVPFVIVSRADADIGDHDALPQSIGIHGTAPAEHYEAALSKLLPDDHLGKL